MPDYMQWFNTGELHYLPLEERHLLSGPWDNIPGAYLPSRVLVLCFNVAPQLTDEIKHQISLLSWVIPHEVKQY